MIHKKRRNRICCFILVAAMFMAGCGKQEDCLSVWKESAHLKGDETEKELYQMALEEDILVVYTVSTRITKVKEAFEKTYPGLCVEIRDVRSPELIKAVKEHEASGRPECDVVVCNDNSGDFRQELVDAGYVVPYMPEDIADKMKKGHFGKTVSFLDEAEMLFYNAGKYMECPIQNIWELTKEQYKGRIYMPSPLRSFSTFAFCGMTTAYTEELEKAYQDYTGKQYNRKSECVWDYFWKCIVKNTVFTNSSDEVCEKLGNADGEADFGIMVSSKYRYKDIGYKIEPVYHLIPFSGCVTTYALMLATGSRNVNTAKLFIRYLLGGSDGRGEGYQPFCTLGTWSARKDVADGNPVPMEEIDLIQTDVQYLIQNRKSIEKFWLGLLAEK
ncbi:ABC transporter substrate-binding protein [[Clostridium] polysaccharolyticum]|uniref:Iron(III) transport system substrate-binding protein n=1 Tax=[Clostridium] polysaccharolyticum TaxID=29364 RepID=A0A1H9Z8R3_9FIRM|nr:substrate-binding domain-containing protein [[Clostridium] polysaccharolyticum]SES77911.1 iron(III) transport system substrate-binding protein [[Clostridium] polysaccharolyticum]